MKKISFFFSVSLLLSNVLFAQFGGRNSLKEYDVKAYTTDKNIEKESSGHACYVNTDVASRKTLVLHLNGTSEGPRSIQYFPKMAANNGFNVVVLNYKNDVSAKTACKNSNDPDAYENFRREIIEGHNFSGFIDVDSVNCINFRLLRLLQFLHKSHPKEGWNNFFSGDNITWSNIIVSGHSQGGGTAALMARYYKLKRVLLFAAPSDYSEYFKKHAKWTYRPHQTDANNYYAFSDLYDRQVDFSTQYEEWQNLGLLAFGDTIRADNKRILERDSHLYYTKQSIFGNAGNHSLMIVDRFLFLDEEKVPVFEPYWKKMLGIQ